MTGILQTPRDDQMALARLIALFPQLDISILSAAIERTNSTEAAIALVRKMTHLADDREERPQSGRRERERKVTSEISPHAEEAPRYTRPVTARTRRQLDEDEIIARDLQVQIDRAPTARTKQRQLDEDEMLARVEQAAEDEKIARKYVMYPFLASKLLPFWQRPHVLFANRDHAAGTSRFQMDLASGREPQLMKSRPASALRKQMFPSQSDAALSDPSRSGPGSLEDFRPHEAVQSHHNLVEAIETSLAKNGDSLSRSGGINNLALEDLDPNDPRRVQLIAEREVIA